MESGQVLSIFVNQKAQCLYDGGEIGSTDVVKTKPRNRCASDLNRKKTTIANDNFAIEDYRLAA